jgi:hypothetical protein
VADFRPTKIRRRIQRSVTAEGILYPSEVRLSSLYSVYHWIRIKPKLQINDGKK